jgi:hypothetical protein
VWRARAGLPEITSSKRGEGAVVVAVVAVPVVETALIQIVDVVAVRHGLVRAALVAAVTGDWRATRGIRGGHGDGMLIEVAIVGGVEVAIVKVVDVTFVANSRVTALLTVDVGMTRMNVVAHGSASFAQSCIRCLQTRP